jgi:hypothetical protein
VTYAFQRAIVLANLMLILLALPAQAQLQAGENTSLNLTGNLSFGYNADFSNLTGSDHSLTPSGNADLNGFYYNPSFLSFDVQPFYDQSRTNSSSLSLFDSSGVSASATIFSGSSFPGSITYSRIYNSDGEFAIPGQANYTTRGNSDNLAIGWGLHLPDYPNLSLQFTDGGGSNTLFGTNDESTVHAKTFALHASQTLADFSLTGGYEYNKTHALTPDFLTGVGPTTSDSSGNSFYVGAAHKLPARGSASIDFDRSDVSSSDSMGGSYTGTIDTVAGGVGFQPITNLDLGVNTQYTNNLTGMLYQSYIVSGVILPATTMNYATNSLDVNSHANYLIQRLHLTMSANADYRQQTVLGATLNADTFNEMISYGNDFLGGFINATAGVTQNIVSFSTNSSSLGQFESVSYQRTIHGWNLSGSYDYTRNTQTVLIGYTSSGHGYSAGIGRKLSPYSYWSFNAVGTKTDFNNIPGSGSSGNGYSTSLSLKRFGISGTYNRSDGTSILTPTGLTPITNPTPIVNPLQEVMFGGKAYGIGASLTPKRGLILSANYSDARSNTTATALATSQNSTRLLNGLLQYKVRQLWIVGGYLKLQQGFSITGQPPMSDTSFYVGITRWFRFF